MTTWSYNISKDMTTWSPSSERRFAMPKETFFNLPKDKRNLISQLLWTNFPKPAIIRPV